MGIFKRFFALTIYEKKDLFRKLFFRPFQKIGFKHYGKGSFIYYPLLIKGKNAISIGEHVKIGNASRLEIISEWKGSHFDASISIGDRTQFVGDLHLISAGKVTIGRNCVFSKRIFITNANHDYSQLGVSVGEQRLIIKDVSIGDNCFFGMDTKVFPGVKVGNNVIVGANSIVMSDLPDNCVAVGVPAKVIKLYNKETKIWESSLMK